MRNGRDRAGTSVAIAGFILLVFGLFWWSFGAKMLVKYPSGQKREIMLAGSVTSYALPHGIARLDAPETTSFTGILKWRTLDDDYTAKRAVLLEARAMAGKRAVPGAPVDAEDVYVFDRIDGRNLKSSLSTSGGRVVDRSGTVYPAFPVGTGKESYEVYCADTDSAFTVTFRRETKAGGLKVYVFEGSFRKRPLVRKRARMRGLPLSTTFGKLKEELRVAGIPLDEMFRSASARLTEREKKVIADFPDSRRVELEYFASLRWAALVEPVSGTVVDIPVNRLDIYVGTEKREFLPLLQVLASRADDPLVSRYMGQLEQQEVLKPKKLCSVEERWRVASVRELIRYAGWRKSRVRWARTYLLYASLLTGALTMILGLLLRRERHHHHGGHTHQGGGGAHDG